MNALDLPYRHERVRAVAAAGTLNGIGWIEIASADQRTLDVFFLHPLPGETGGLPAGPALTAAQLRIEGGVRVRDPRVLNVTANGNRLRVRVQTAGDFSTYRLRVSVTPNSSLPPPGFDPVLAWIDFSFKIGCPNPFDCKPAVASPAPAQAHLAIDYLARDYRGLRGLMLDRLAATTPAWRERNPTDQHVMLVELLAATADQLSYAQDAVATEAYLGTARRRASLRRHARLLDYRVHQGCNARTWLHVAPAPGSDLDGLHPLPAGTAVLTGVEPQRIDRAAMTEALAQGAAVFETLHEQRLHAAQNRVMVHTWSNAIDCLPAGTTRAALQAPSPLGLSAGDALLFEQVRSHVTGAEERDPARRWVVRLTRVEPAVDPLDGMPLALVEWHPQDALPFAFPIVATLPLAGGLTEVTLTVARGNLVLADHGERHEEADALIPPEVPVAGRYRPRLRRTGVTHAEPYDHASARGLPASRALRQNLRDVEAWIRLQDAEVHWQARADLLASDRAATEFSVEMEHDASAWLRFGDGVRGRAPAAGTRFRTLYRIGNGTAGNVGADVLRLLVSPLGEVTDVRNPLAARGGMEAESAEQVRRYAPQAFRVQERAVTETDYAVAALRHPEVQRARADFRWSGSWYTTVVTVDRRGGLPVSGDPQFRAELLALLDQLRTMGGDVALRDPRRIPLDIVLRVCLEPGHFSADVHQRLREVFGSTIQPDGRLAFFHPDRLTFGTALYLSALYEVALEVDGVASVQALRFQRWGKQDAGELAAGVLRVDASEIAICDNDRNRPENGAISFEFPG